MHVYEAISARDFDPLVLSAHVTAFNLHDGNDGRADTEEQGSEDEDEDEGEVLELEAGDEETHRVADGCQAGDG